MNIKKVAIIGAGVMGSSIAQIVAREDFQVIIRSRRGEKGLKMLHENIEYAKSKKILTEDQAALLLSNISCTTHMREALEDADFVIEAVIEDLKVKKDIFQEMDTFSPKHTILTSNTSSLSIGELANVTKRPDKVMGIHFFNPPSIIRLVEITSTTFTSKETVEEVVAFSEKLRKKALRVKDSPGFIVNRTIAPMINEATYILMEGIAPVEVIDDALKLGARHPIGPLALADIIGIDVCLSILNEFHERFNNPKYAPCPLFEKMVKEGHLGRKSGKGFYTYE